jgi:hypothetical protein
MSVLVQSPGNLVTRVAGIDVDGDRVLRGVIIAVPVHPGSDQRHPLPARTVRVDEEALGIGGVEDLGLVEVVLDEVVERRRAAATVGETWRRVVEDARAVETLNLEVVVVHDAHVVGLAVVIVGSAVTQVQRVPELVHQTRVLEQRVPDHEVVASDLRLTAERLAERARAL